MHQKTQRPDHQTIQASQDQPREQHNNKRDHKSTARQRDQKRNSPATNHHEPKQVSDCVGLYQVVKPCTTVQRLMLCYI